MSASSPKLHIETQGEGPLLVLAHGFAGSARNFRVQARALRDLCRVVSYDARGHARSEAPVAEGEYTLDALVGDFGAVARNVQGDRQAPFVAGGLSMGAATALEFALRHPERVRALLLAAYPAPGGAGMTRREWGLGFADAIRARGADAAGAEYVWGRRSRFDPKGAELIRQGFLEHPPHAMEKMLRGVLAHLVEPAALGSRLAAIAVPTLVIVGGDDTESLEPSRELAAAIPNAEFVVIPEAGHVVNLAQPALFNAQARRFLERVLKG